MKEQLPPQGSSENKNLKQKVKHHWYYFWLRFPFKLTRFMYLNFFFMALIVLLIQVDQWIAARNKANKALDLAMILATYQTKELCSCLFVEGRPQAECMTWVRGYYPMVPMNINLVMKEIRSKWYPEVAYYRWLGPRRGCQAVSAPAP